MSNNTVECDICRSMACLACVEGSKDDGETVYCARSGAIATPGHSKMWRNKVAGMLGVPFGVLAYILIGQVYEYLPVYGVIGMLFMFLIVPGVIGFGTAFFAANYLAKNPSVLSCKR